MAELQSLEQVGAPTIMACPICTGALYEVVVEDESRFCCSQGHDFPLDDICPGIEESLSGIFGAIAAALKTDK